MIATFLACVGGFAIMVAILVGLALWIVSTGRPGDVP